MQAEPVPRPPERELPRLDRPQRFGFLPTAAFWNRRDVRRISGPLIGGFAFLWFMMLGVFVTGSIPLWANIMLSLAGLYLFVGLLERYVRARLRRRRALQASPDNTDAPREPLDGP